MHRYNLMGIAVNNRKDVAPKVQDVLTQYGDIIKSRIGLNEYENEGFIILTLRDGIEINELQEKLCKIPDVKAQILVI